MTHMRYIFDIVKIDHINTDAHYIDSNYDTKLTLLFKLMHIKLS